MIPATWSLLSSNRDHVDGIVSIRQRHDALHFVILKCANCDGPKPKCGGLKADILRRVPSFHVDVARPALPVLAAGASVYCRQQDDRRTLTTQS